MSKPTFMPHIPEGPGLNGQETMALIVVLCIAAAGVILAFAIGAMFVP